jgi:hypothetical protein
VLVNRSAQLHAAPWPRWLLPRERYFPACRSAPVSFGPLGGWNRMNLGVRFCNESGDRTMTSVKLLVRLLLSTPLLLAFSTSCAAPRPAKPSTRLIDFGIVRLVGPLTRLEDPKTAVGFTSSGPGRSVFEKRTTEIPAVQGVTFGIRYRIEGSPGKPVTVEEIIRHPPMTRPDGTVLREERTKDQVSPADGVVDQKFLYLLREPYEVVPGDWSLTVAIDGTTAIEQHFTIIAAK